MLPFCWLSTATFSFPPPPSKPHVCVQYDTLEAAQLAVESLNGAEVAGRSIKVRLRLLWFR